MSCTRLIGVGLVFRRLCSAFLFFFFSSFSLANAVADAEADCFWISYFLTSPSFFTSADADAVADTNSTLFLFVSSLLSVC